MAGTLPPATLLEIERLCGLYPHPQSALLPALHLAQGHVGYLSEAAMQEVARSLGLPLTEVMAVATFYSMFHTERLGRHEIRVCTNLSCYLNGCDRVLDYLCGRLGIRPGETTPDGRVTVEAVECLAACEDAPVMLVDHERRACVTPAAIDELLGKLE